MPKLYIADEDDDDDGVPDYKEDYSSYEESIGMSS